MLYVSEPTCVLYICHDVIRFSGANELLGKFTQIRSEIVLVEKNVNFPDKKAELRKKT